MIKLEGASEAALLRNQMTFVELRHLSAIEMLKKTADDGIAMAEYALEHEKFKEFITSGEKFDLMILDVHYNDVMLG